MAIVPSTSSEALPKAPAALAGAWRALAHDRVLLALVVIAGALLLLVPAQLPASVLFVADALGRVAPWLALSVLIAAAAKATGAEQQVARTFAGREARTVIAAALFGALSPFCSCGVIPLIAALLAAGVPLAPVMAFWLASPIMDPSMFVLTAAQLGMELAVAKTLAAVAIGLLGGLVTMLVARGSMLDGALKVAALPSCAARKQLAPPAPVWRFWAEPERAQTFLVTAGATAWFLLRWLTLAFLLEGLMTTYVPAELIAGWLGRDSAAAVPLAVLLGVPAYLNGFAAIPLVGGLLGLGMSPAAGLGFMVAGGVTSVPAAIAVWALVQSKVFALYLGLALAGAMLTALAYAGWLAL
jgi:uncharacterized membrane protein YraQ (UPF0718 family)